MIGVLRGAEVAEMKRATAEMMKWDGFGRRVSARSAGTARSRVVSFEPVRSLGFPGLALGVLAIFCLSWILGASTATGETFRDERLHRSDPASLSSLLIVPAATRTDSPMTTDEELLAAVAHGNEPGLERKNPFRKRSIDLFRSEHDVEIWRQEMRVRFRLRPKSRETMSVEVRF